MVSDILSSRKVGCENFCVADLEVNLGESIEKYPSIPAIEVSIPHFHASLNSTFFKRYIANPIKSLR